MGEYSKVDITEQSMDVLDQQKKVKNNYDLSLSSLGIVTSSEFFITDNDMVTNVPQLFDKGDREKTYILRDNNTLEYNISTRRLNVIEPTVIDILPAGDMPTKAKGSLLDTIAPPLITGLGMVGIRFFISQFSSNSGLNDSMLAMTIAMPFMSAVTSLYNRRKQSKDYKQSVSEWKEKYENYINETIIKKKIVKWQKDEIVYLNKAYPRMCTFLLRQHRLLHRLHEQIMAYFLRLAYALLNSRSCLKFGEPVLQSIAKVEIQLESSRSSHELLEYFLPRVFLK